MNDEYGPLYLNHGYTMEKYPKEKTLLKPSTTECLHHYVEPVVSLPLSAIPSLTSTKSQHVQIKRSVCIVLLIVFSALIIVLLMSLSLNIFYLSDIAYFKNHNPQAYTKPLAHNQQKHKRHCKWSRFSIRSTNIRSRPIWQS